MPSEERPRRRSGEAPGGAGPQGRSAERRQFTVKEANAALPALRQVMGKIQLRMKWLASNQPEIAYLVKQFKILNDAPVPREYLANLLKLREALGEVESMGCQLKDVGMGLIDFPSLLHGKEVLLCWKVGEASVGYYHDLESGYSGRRLLPEGADPGEESTEN